MTPYSLEHTQEKNPLVDYAVKRMWGNPELDSQHQIKLARVSGLQGFINDFAYWGKRHYLPNSLSFYHVFTLGGLDIGFWNMGSRGKSWYPQNTWIKASTFARNRGVTLDIYTSEGTMFPRDETYIMDTFEGGTLVAIPKNENYPLPLGKNLYMHCYTIDINTFNVKPENLVKYSVGYVGGVYFQHENLERVRLNYDTWMAYNMGQVLFWHNGSVKPIDSVTPVPGDLIEVSYDPSIEMIAKFEYKKMPSYYSEGDKKKKVILFPGFDDKPRLYRYYDDCHFYVSNRLNGQAYYYHRNSEEACRQLTHQDYSLCAPYIDLLAGRLISDDTTKLTTMADIDIMVSYHKTNWDVKLGPTSSRINDLYLLENRDLILNAMTGNNSRVKEWTANALEFSPTNFVLNKDIRKLTTTSVRDALGYNGCAVAMSNTPLYMPYDPPGTPGHVPITTTPPYSSGLGYEVPPTYVDLSTAYEYDKDGLLLRLVEVRNQEWYSPGENCWYVEWALGKATTWLDYKVSQTDIPFREGYGLRVYKAKYAIDPDWVPPLESDPKEIKISKDGSLPYGDKQAELNILDKFGTVVDPGDLPDGGKIVGDWIDITGTDEYEILNGHVVLRFDTINYIGMVVTDYHHLYNEFDLTHIDNSLTFAITHKWPIGGTLLPLAPGQIDIWMNNHPLIENVDYYLDFPNVYITNKMWLKEGDTQSFRYRGIGLTKNGLVNTSELGIVADGVIGFNGRYNLRIDRPTKTIIGGRLHLTHLIDASEDIHHGRNAGIYNGWPYEVKHIYCANKYVDLYDTYWDYEGARALDKKVSDYLTETVTYKPDEPTDVVYMEQDKYRLYSPFLSKIINEVITGFIDVPPVSGKQIPYAPGVVDELTREYQWLLKYDPVINDVDMRFFTVQPYNNLKILTVTPDQLTFISQVNNLFLKGKIQIEGHFEVKHV